MWKGLWSVELIYSDLSCFFFFPWFFRLLRLGAIGGSVLLECMSRSFVLVLFNLQITVRCPWRLFLHLTAPTTALIIPIFILPGKITFLHWNLPNSSSTFSSNYMLLKSLGSQSSPLGLVWQRLVWNRQVGAERGDKWAYFKASKADQRRLLSRFRKGLE